MTIINSTTSHIPLHPTASNNDLFTRSPTNIKTSARPAALRRLFVAAQPQPQQQPEKELRTQSETRVVGRHSFPVRYASPRPARGWSEGVAGRHGAPVYVMPRCRVTKVKLETILEQE
mmetsp:Transcript_18240/g.48450  ORF Transcript_18240/g.48450 Transcript_18240/m.48450 type:complete len:118 (+) Transcript_18240:270-623(+)